MKVKVDIKYLLAGVNVKHRDIVTIIDEGKEVPGHINVEDTMFQISVRLPNAEIKQATLNKTTMVAFIKAWGDESSEWVGKKAAVKIEEGRLVFGEEKDIIYLVPMPDKTTEDAKNTDNEGIPIIEREDSEPTQQQLDETFGKDEERQETV